MNAHKIRPEVETPNPKQLEVVEAQATRKKGLWSWLMTKLFAPTMTSKDWRQLEYREDPHSDRHLFVDPYCQWRIF